MSGASRIEGAGLTRQERETVIVFSDADDDAIVNTASPTVHKKLIKLGYSVTQYNGQRGRFLVPKRHIRLPRPPRMGQPMSDERKASLQKGRSASKSTSGDGGNAPKSGKPYIGPSRPANEPETASLGGAR